MVGRILKNQERASPNYRMQEVESRRSGERSWEVVEVTSGVVVTSGISSRDEALRVVRGFERLHQTIAGGLPDHVTVH